MSTLAAGSSGATEAAGESPRATAEPKPARKAEAKDGTDYHHDPEGGNIIVSHGEHTVVRSTEGTRDVPAYASATHRNLVARQQHFDAIEHLAQGKHDRTVIKDLHHVLNQRAKSWDDAKGYIQEAVEEKMQDTHWDHRAVIANKLLEPQMRATWNR